MRPAFEAYLSSNQSIGNASWTKVTWDAETYDTDSAFASNKFTVPSGKDGKYFVYTSTCFTANTTGQRLASLYVNGSERRRITGINGSGSNQAFSADGAVLELSASDYVEVYVYQDRGGNLELIGLQARSYSRCIQNRNIMAGIIKVNQYQDFNGNTLFTSDGSGNP